MLATGICRSVAYIDVSAGKVAKRCACFWAGRLFLLSCFGSKLTSWLLRNHSALVRIWTGILESCAFLGAMQQQASIMQQQTSGVWWQGNRATKCLRPPKYCDLCEIPIANVEERRNSSNGVLLRHCIRHNGYNRDCCILGRLLYFFLSTFWNAFFSFFLWILWFYLYKLYHTCMLQFPPFSTTLPWDDCLSVWQNSVGVWYLFHNYQCVCCVLRSFFHFFFQIKLSFWGLQCFEPERADSARFFLH